MVQMAKALDMLSLDPKSFNSVWRDLKVVSTCSQKMIAIDQQVFCQ